MKPFYVDRCRLTDGTKAMGWKCAGSEDVERSSLVAEIAPATVGFRSFLVRRCRRRRRRRCSKTRVAVGKMPEASRRSRREGGTERARRSSLYKSTGWPKTASRRRTARQCVCDMVARRFPGEDAFYHATYYRL